MLRAEAAAEAKETSTRKAEKRFEYLSFEGKPFYRQSSSFGFQLKYFYGFFISFGGWIRQILVFSRPGVNEDERSLSIVQSRVFQEIISVQWLFSLEPIWPRFLWEVFGIVWLVEIQLLAGFEVICSRNGSLTLLKRYFQFQKGEFYSC